MQELKPCPFCGTEAVMTEHEPHDHSPGLVALTGLPGKHPGSWTIECVACSCGMIHATREEVVAAWNRRISASIADTAGAKPVAYYSDWPGERVYAEKPHGWNEPGRWLVGNAIADHWHPLFAATPASSVADAAGASEPQRGELESLLASHVELNMNNYHDAEVDHLNDWAVRAYDFPESRKGVRQ